MIVHGRRAHAVSAVAQAISAEGGQVERLTDDLADPGDCARLISRALVGGDVDILVNNAGAFANRGWDEATPQDGRRCTPQTSRPWSGASRASCRPCAAGWGRILQIGTGEAINPFPTMPDYAANKAALLNLTVSLAKHADHLFGREDVGRAPARLPWFAWVRA